MHCCVLSANSKEAIKILTLPCNVKALRHKRIMVKQRARKQRINQT